MTGKTRPRVMVVVTAAVTARLFMRGYVEYLADEGYDVMLVADDLSELEEPLAARGIVVRSLPMRRDPDPVRDLISLARMVRLIARARPDSIIFATPKASLLTSVAAWLLRVPVRVYELWGLRFETAQGIPRTVFRSMERIIAWCSTAVVANSTSLADRAVELGVTSRSRVVVPASGSSHGVDADHFSRDVALPPLDLETAQFLASCPGHTIGFVGRLHPDKGVDELIEAARSLHRAGMQVRVVLVGGQEGAEVPAAGELPLHAVGDVDDVRPYLAKFDVLVLMSKREGFPNVVLEAAAMQVPAVVSDATGCVDSVEDGVTGVVVPVGDVRALADALSAVFSDPNARAKMGKAARRRVLEEFVPRDVWAAHEEHVRGGAGARSGSKKMAL